MRFSLAFLIGWASISVAYAAPRCEGLFALTTAPGQEKVTAMIEELAAFYEQILAMPATDPLRTRLYEDFKLRFKMIQSLTSEPLNRLVLEGAKARGALERDRETKLEETRRKQDRALKGHIEKRLEIPVQRHDPYLGAQRDFATATFPVQWAHDGAYVVIHHRHTPKATIIDTRNSKTVDLDVSFGYLSESSYRFASVRNGQTKITDLETGQTWGPFPAIPSGERTSLNDRYLVTREERKTWLSRVLGSTRTIFTVHDYINNRSVELGELYRLSPNGRRVAFHGKNDEIKLMDLDTWTVVRSVRGKLDLQMQGHLLIAGDRKKTVIDMDTFQTIDIKDNRLLETDIRPLKFVLGKSLLVFASIDGYWFYDIAKETAMLLPANGNLHMRDHAPFAVANAGYEGHMLDLRTGDLKKLYVPYGKVSKDGRFFFSEHHLSMLDAETGTIHNIGSLAEILGETGTALFRDKGDYVFAPFNNGADPGASGRKIGLDQATVSPDGLHIVVNLDETTLALYRVDP